MIVPDTPENVKKCICPRCPSMPADCPDETLYCARGKSCCEIHARACFCTACPVYKENKLETLYFCDKEAVGSIVHLIRKKGENEDLTAYQTMVSIRELAETGMSRIISMGSQKSLPFSFKDLKFIPAQVSRIPLEREDSVNMSVILGPSAAKPLKLASPIMISGMSYGATSKNVRLIISKVAADLNIAYSSGEGGILEEEYQNAPHHLIGQYATDRGDIQLDLLRILAAVEIRFGQGAYPGKGSYIPSSKITGEVAKTRGLKGLEQSHSPAHFDDILNMSQLKAKVDWLREATGGIPIGAKLGCGRIESDIEALVEGGVDFIALDGFGAGTGATEQYVRDNVGLPIIAAIPRALSALKMLGAKDRITLVAGGGLRMPSDFAKCLALGADAVYIGTAALIAIGCEQYRICHTGMCPTGITTHAPLLERQLNFEMGAKRLNNFVNASTGEIANIVRLVGKSDVNKLDHEDLVSFNKDLAALTGVNWLNGE